MSLEAYRKQIDQIDDEILKKLEMRKIISKMIGKLKKKKGLDIDNSVRENEIINRLSEKSKLKKNDIEEVYNSIFKLSKKIQKNIVKAQ